jgi:hypothetical protein
MEHSSRVQHEGAAVRCMISPAGLLGPCEASHARRLETRQSGMCWLISLSKHSGAATRVKERVARPDTARGRNHAAHGVTRLHHAPLIETPRSTQTGAAPDNAFRSLFQCASAGAAAPGFGFLSTKIKMMPSPIANAVQRKQFSKLSTMACVFTFILSIVSPTSSR